MAQTFYNKDDIMYYKEGVIMYIINLSTKEVKDENGNIINIKVEIEENNDTIDISNLKPIAIYDINAL